MSTDERTCATNAARNTFVEYRLAIDALDREIVSLAAQMNANEYRLLVMIREFDERGGWLKWGLSSCSEWLHFRCDLGLSAAREKVRVARALKVLPEVSAAFEKGVLSYSKVRALTRVATADDEDLLLVFARETTAARVEERCRQMRNVEPASVDGANRAHSRRKVSVWRDDASGTMRLSVEVPIETGELIERALDKALQHTSAEGPEFAETGWQALRADALVEIAKTYLSGAEHNGCSEPGERQPCTADHYQVVVHTDASALTGDTSRSDLPLETLKRLTCDGSVIPMTDGPDGEPLDVGRKRRTVGTAIRRALWARDRGCSFPGCTHTRFVDAHHVRHWANGGETSVANTMLLCSAHHRLVHEGGYTIRKDTRGAWYFSRRDGRAVPACGYSSDDMVDDDVGDTSVWERPDVHPSAEGCERNACQSEVREPPGLYRAGAGRLTDTAFASPRPIARRSREARLDRRRRAC